MNHTIIENLISLNGNHNSNSYIKEFAGYINFKDIEPYLRFTSRNLDIDEKENKDHNDKLYQRIRNESRVKEISQFLLKHYKDDEDKRILPFPTPVTLSIQAEIINEPKEKYLINQQFNPTKYFQDNAHDNILYKNKLYLNKSASNKCIFIVDGQHRLAGIQEFLAFYPSQETLVYVTLLVNYDLSMQAKVFANINFKVKPVNKSLYYDIFGSLPEEYNEMTFAHMIAKRINKDEKIGGLIKMLGVGAGTVSLAFVVETITDELIKPKKNQMSPALYDICQTYILNQEEFKKKYGKLGKLFVEYFKYIKDNLKETFPLQDSNGSYNSTKYESILTKTTGMFSLLKLLNRINIKQILETSTTSDDEMKDKLINEIEPIINILKKHEKELFSSSSRFAAGGSKGLQTGLYTTILSKLDHPEESI